MPAKKDVPVELIVRLYVDEGLSTTAIAAREDVDCSANTVARTLKAAGVPLRSCGAKRADVDNDHLVRLFTVEGISMREIAARPEVRLSVSAVHRRLIAAGVKTGVEQEVDDAFLIRLYVVEGLTMQQIADRPDVPVSLNTIWRRLRAAGVEIRPAGFRRAEVDDELIIRLYVVEGLSCEQIAAREDVDCHAGTVRRRLIDAGVEMRPAGGVRAEVDREWLEERYLAGESMNSLAEQADVSDSTIFKLLREMGVPTREKTGSIWLSARGYPTKWVPGRGPVGVHRLVMEEHLGRELESFEQVHHRDKNKLNYELANLELWSTGQHPSGERVTDLVNDSVWVLKLYAPHLLADDDAA